MSGIYTPIQTNIVIGAGASATLYIDTRNIGLCNLAVSSTRNLQIDVNDGMGNTSVAVPQETVPHLLNTFPTGVSFSTGGRSYQSKPKVGGISVTTIALRLPLCGTWFEVTLGNQEGASATVNVLGTIL